MMIRSAISTTFFAIATSSAGAVAEPLTPFTAFEGNITITAKNGKTQPIHVSIQSWRIIGRKHATQELPLRGLYVAHLLSGHISVTIDGQTTDYLSGSYWTIEAGATMQVKGLGEATADLETIVVSKQ